MMIFKPDGQHPPDERLIGGKARNLALLQEGFPVPPWFAITTEAFNHVVANCTDREEIGQFLLEVPFPTQLLLDIRKSIAALNLADKYLAVRSSAVGEDSGEASFAGQLESFLYVHVDELDDAIRKVWASAFSQRVHDYRLKRGLDPEAMKVAVIIQEIIGSEVAGVAFSADPVSGDRDTVVVSAVYGLGEGLVSGLLDADCYRVHHDQISMAIACKPQAVVHDQVAGSGTITVDIPVEKQGLPCLDEDQLKLIAQTAGSISDFYGYPQDIEWAMAKGKLYILQSRPITTLAGSKTPSTGVRRVWDNSNIVESYSGITTPLTFSFIQEVYTEVYQEFCRIMGVEEDLIRENGKIFLMLGLIRGRVYYNLLNWYQVLSLLPGYEINAQFMELMMGVKEQLDILPSVVHSKRNPYLRLLRLCSRLIHRLFTLNLDIKDFYRLLNQTLEPYENRDLSKIDSEELVDLYHALEKKLLRQWHAPLVNDFFAMIFYGILKQLIVKWSIDERNTLQNDLLSGEGGIISTQPVENIRAMVRMIDLDEPLRGIFLREDAEQILQSLVAYPELQEAFQNHLRKFGIRCANELKLETVTYQHDPRMLIDLLKSYVKQGNSNSSESSPESSLRRVAEERVASVLKRHPVRRRIFHWVLRQTRDKVKNRENLRFERTRIYSLVREIFLALGLHLRESGILEDSRDIFYLSKEEIFAYLNGTSVATDLKSLVQLRRAEFAGYEREHPADRFATNGPVYQSARTGSGPTSPGEDGLKGIGCSPGAVRATVKMVTDPYHADSLEGNILMAERTDPGWVPLFPLAKGLLVERGSLLSHSAIVAREMGIPAIVSITGLTRLLKDGDLVEMDGSTGIIKILGE